MKYLNYIKEFNKLSSKSKNEKVDIKTIKYLFPYLKSNQNKIILSLLCMFILSLVTLPAPYLTKYIIDTILPQKNIIYLSHIIGIIGILYIAKVFLSLAISYLFSIISNSIQLKIRKDVFKKIISLPLSYLNKKQSGYLLARLNESQGLNVFFSSNILGLAIDILEMIFIFVILLMMNIKMTLITVCFIPAYLIIFKKFRLGLILSSKNLYESTAKLSEKIQESFSGITTVKSFGSENREVVKIGEYLNGFYKAGITQNIIISIASELVFIVSSFVGLIILWFSIYEIIENRFTLGMYIAFSAYSVKLLMPIQKLAAVSVNIQPAMAALSRVTDIIKQISEDEDNQRKIILDNLNGGIEFRNVSFNYTHENRFNILDDINFNISQGTKLAIVGESGAGKTTLISLILQLYKPTKGKILFNNIDASSIKIRTLREKIGFVSQDIFLFEDTIKNNIVYGNPNTKESEVIRASKESNAFEFISNLPNGFDTIVGERGITLSMGQRQRISIARALLLNPDLFIFDEATSSLDSISQKEIQNFIKKITNKTVIIIAHSIGTVMLSDFAIVLDKGKLIQQGPPAELIKKDGSFKNLFYTTENIVY